MPRQHWAFCASSRGAAAGSFGIDRRKHCPPAVAALQQRGNRSARESGSLPGAGHCLHRRFAVGAEYGRGSRPVRTIFRSPLRFRRARSGRARAHGRAHFDGPRSGRAAAEVRTCAGAEARAGKGRRTFIGTLIGTLARAFARKSACKSARTFARISTASSAPEASANALSVPVNIPLNPK